MFANFKEAFDNSHKVSKVPKEVMEYLSEELPSGFKYVNLQDGIVAAVPSNIEDFKMQMKVGVDLNSIDIPNHIHLKDISDLNEFLYRTQQSLLIKNETITVNGEEMKLNELVKSPFGEMTHGPFHIVPSPFKGPFPIKLHSDDVEVQFNVIRNPYPYMDKSLFESSDESNCLKISYIIDEKKSNLKLNLNLDIKRSKEIREVIDALKIVKAFQQGTLKLFNETLPSPDDSSFSVNGIEESTQFWEKILSIEEKLQVTFNPGSDIPKEDYIWIDRLYRSLIEQKPYKEHVNLNELSIESFDKTKLEIGKGFSVTYISHSEFILLDAKFEIFEAIAIFNMRITGYKKDTDKVDSYMISVEPDKESKICMSTRIFTKLTDAQDFNKDGQNLNLLVEAEKL
ncbi:abortive infection system toxin AbiGii family protein [Paenibacillus sp. UASWS1643]|uniref:abortive infection system toxin AbiGii family protein n=1 Tax=Paenibacillus sp. UASWS1643 TaxID=2580422 RepID=UPI001239B67A|nr:abortive infection system toxin AbiGii family protein [Paenibacillus sp. UASWS1643]KAA8748204.1 hypothetical protein FE296_19120 [Paenibacillus sp. UASWS1643]